MSTSNNSGNNSNGNTIFIGGGGGGGGGNGITYVPNNPQWISVTYTPVTPGQQYTITGIDLAVPVAEKKKKSEGCSCKKCKEFYQYAEPNQEDGTLICWACRHGY
jgi:hypothetical protein